MLRNEWGKPWEGNERMRAYNQMNKLVKEDGALPRTRLKRQQRGNGGIELASAGATPSLPKGWGDSLSPWMARALLGELASKPSALALIPVDTRLSLIHHLSRLVP